MTMRRLAILVFVVALGCGSGCSSLGGCSAGDMRCHGNTAQMCGVTNGWEDWQSCGSIGESCSTSPSACSGFSGIACCR